VSQYLRNVPGIRFKNAMCDVPPFPSFAQQNGSMKFIKTITVLAQKIRYITTLDFRRPVFLSDKKLAVQCLDQTTGVQKRKYRHRVRQTDR